MDIYLIDGSSYIYRAYFAIKGLSTSRGLPTNAIYGFTNMILKILNEKKPDGIGIVFDRPEPTRRHRAFEEYKAQRPEAPKDLIVQIPYIRRTVEAFGIKVIELPGYEADDILATLSSELAEKGVSVYIVSGDKDILQIVAHRIKMFDPMKNVLYDTEAVQKRYGISPHRIPELLALAGDPIDNIPGIKGVGEKTALEILSFGSLEQLIENPELIKKERLKKLFQENLETIKLSYELSRLDRNVPLSIRIEDLQKKETRWNELLEIFRECEFSSLLRMIPSSKMDIKIILLKPSEIPRAIDTFKNGFAYDLLVSSNKQDSLIGISMVPLNPRVAEGPDTSKNHKISGGDNEVAYFVPLKEDNEIEFIKSLFEDPSIVVVGHNIKKDMLLLRKYGIEFRGGLEDTEIASYLINPLRPNHKLDELTIEYLGIKKMTCEGEESPKNRRFSGLIDEVPPKSFSYNPDEAEGIGSGAPVFGDNSAESLPENLQHCLFGVESNDPLRSKDSPGSNYERSEKESRRGYPISQGSPEDQKIFQDSIILYSSQNSVCKLMLYRYLKKRLAEEGLENVYNAIEIPLIKVLADMESTGIKVNIDLLKSVSKELERELDNISSKIYRLAGEEFNINSPKQLSSILFEKLGLRPKKRTKTGYSTQWSVLEELSREHELPREILNYRSLFKLKTTYVDALPMAVDPSTGRLHTSFNQTATATGRLSSSEPNLQNIPVRGMWAERLRQAFVADEGMMLSADYSQIELRILAHMSKDEGFVNAFKEGLDIHSVTATEIFGIDLVQVTSDMRRIAKTVNFGIIYGMSAFGLSETLGIQRDEAQAYIDQFFARHPAIKEFSLNLINRARELGYAETLFGRKRPIPELKSTNPSTKALGERAAINSPIQGTASDIIKLAMIKIWDNLKTRKLRTKMLLQIHDELLFEVPLEELEYVKELIKEQMEHVVELDVPLVVNISTGKNWAELK